MVNDGDEERREPEQAPPEAAPRPAAAEEPAPRRGRLYRSRRDRMLAGVAGGLADYFDLDATAIRAALVVLTVLTSGALLIAYLIAWVVIPEGPGGAADTDEERGEGDGSAGMIIAGLLLVTVGGLWLLERAGVDLPDGDVLLAGAIVAIGVLLLLSGLVWSGRGRGGLITLGIALSVVASFVISVEVNVQAQGAFGERSLGYTDAAQLDDEYGQVFGSLRLDLRELELPPGTTSIEVSSVFGSAEVLLPPEMPVRVESNAAFGSVEALGREWGGIGQSGVASSDNYAEAERRLEINASAVFGSVEVRR